MDLEIKVEGEGEVSVEFNSYSTNFCPVCVPLKWFRKCCQCFQIFGDGGENENHVMELSAHLKLKHSVDVSYSSAPGWDKDN